MTLHPKTKILNLTKQNFYATLKTVKNITTEGIKMKQTEYINDYIQQQLHHVSHWTQQMEQEGGLRTLQNNAAQWGPALQKYFRLVLIYFDEAQVLALQRSYFQPVISELLQQVNQKFPVQEQVTHIEQVPYVEYCLLFHKKPILQINLGQQTYRLLFLRPQQELQLQKDLLEQRLQQLQAQQQKLQIPLNIEAAYNQDLISTTEYIKRSLFHSKTNKQQLQQQQALQNQLQTATDTLEELKVQIMEAENQTTELQAQIAPLLHILKRLHMKEDESHEESNPEA